MVSEDRPRERLGRKLVKKRRESRRVSLDLPDRFKDGSDGDEDVTASRRNATTMSMNQSIFSMIARAGQQSQTDLGTMVEEDSEESGDERKKLPQHGLDGASRLSRLSSAHNFHHKMEDGDGSKHPKSKHRRALSENKLLRSLPKLKVSSRKDAKTEAPPADQMSSSQLLPPRTTDSDPSSSTQDDPPLKHKLRTTPGQEIHVEKRRGSERKSKQGSTAGLAKGKDSLTLAKRLREIFEFGEVEDVISEYPCWLLQSILLQGYMYITQKHICFYAYIPRKHHDVSKTGYLSKRGRSKYNRYWFVLRGDVLSYYVNPAELYFPRNRINLQYAISAEVLETMDKNKDETIFMVTTDQRKYQFKADSAVSAKEWVRSIQKVIFRTHNEGNSVKISLPIQNILEIEESSMLDFADTVKVRVIDNDETFAIDEYFFAFFNHGQDALNVLRIMINDNEHHQPSERHGEVSASTRTVLGQHDARHRGASNPRIEENVRATLSPLPAPYVARTSMSADSRSSLDVARKSLEVRRSMDAGRTLRRPSHEMRRSFSGSRREKQRHGTGDRSPLSPLAGETKPPDTSDSAATSLGLGTESSVAVQSMDDSSASASQILGRSDVFRTPTLRGLGVAASNKSDSVARHSQDTTRSSSVKKSTVQSPPLSQQAPAPGHRHASLGTLDTEDFDGQQANPRLSGSTFTSYPLQKASGIAGFLRTRSKKMGSLLATESMGYYEKVSGMLAGGRKHYHVAEGLQPTDQVHGNEEDEDATKAAENFREHFAFPETEQLQSSFFASLQRILPNYGKIYVSGRYFCFRSLMPANKTKLILPMRDIENVTKERGFRLGYHGLSVAIRGHEELFFEFSRAEYRDECAIAILRILESTKYIEDEQSSSSGIDTDDEAAKAEHDLLQEAREEIALSAVTENSEMIRAADHDRVPLVFDDPLASIVDFKPSEPLTIVCLTIGSRGDVQPYIALCKDLIKEGHKPRIATHTEFGPWVKSHGIDFAPVDGNPAELMKICVEQGMFTVGFLMEANSKFRGWLDDLCSSAWTACQGADLLIESPSAMAGIHIAEALEIPYFRAFTMPWTRTRAYPHAFWVSEKSMGGAWNYMTYTMFDGVFWKAISGQINRWRRRELGLQNTSPTKMQPQVRPFLYNFSPSVVTPPLDWPDWIRVTGYWFLDEADTYEPPADLVAFIEKAREDGKPLVYVGFGSIVIDDPAALTQTVVDSVLKADVRCVLSKGWSDRLETKDPSKPEVELPSAIFQIKAAPHDWLFKQMDAAVHHGGSGTTGASLRAGIPTVIKPFFGDQFFYASRVEKLGVGMWLKKVNTRVFARVLWEVTNSQRMIVKAKVLGQKIRRENGTQVAIQTIYRELDRARSQINKHVQEDGDETDEFEEDWTLIDDFGEIEVPKPHQMQPFPPSPLVGMSQDATQLGRGSLALGSMVLKGASGSSRPPLEPASKE